MKLLVIAGARPNFMKVAPIIRAAQGWNVILEGGSASPGSNGQISVRLLHTGQHYDAKMSDIFFQELKIPAPDFNLDVGSGSHAAQTASIMTRFEPIVVQEQPDWVVVVGDVNSTMACTLVCSKLGVRVAHVEAGLRSFDRTMPEEINRIVTDALADLLLTPSEDGNANLLREGISPEKIRLVGNVMIDSLVESLPKARQSPVLSRLGVSNKRFTYVTLHRPANVDSPENLRGLMRALDDVSRQLPVVFPMHPRTRKMAVQFGLMPDANANFKVIEPVGYLDSLALTESARVVVTDSGGLQEESTFFRTPCLTLRPNTERPITVTLGSNTLTDLTRLPGHFDRVLAGESFIGQVPPLWDGHAAERIIQELVKAV